MGRLTWVAEALPNSDDPCWRRWPRARSKPGTGEYFAPRVLVSVQLLSEAIRRAGSDDPTKVAFALEGLRYASPLGEVMMRKSDHQLLLPQVVSTVVPVDGKTVKVGAEGTVRLPPGQRDTGARAGPALGLPHEAPGRRLSTKPRCTESGWPRKAVSAVRPRRRASRPWRSRRPRQKQRPHRATLLRPGPPRRSSRHPRPPAAQRTQRGLPLGRRQVADAPGLGIEALPVAAAAPAGEGRHPLLVGRDRGELRVDQRPGEPAVVTGIAAPARLQAGVLPAQLGEQFGLAPSFLRVAQRRAVERVEPVARGQHQRRNCWRRWSNCR